MAKSADTDLISLYTNRPSFFRMDFCRKFQEEIQHTCTYSSILGVASCKRVNISQCAELGPALIRAIAV